jgi:hypothetical protein
VINWRKMALPWTMPDGGWLKAVVAKFNRPAPEPEHSPALSRECLPIGPFCC